MVVRARGLWVALLLSGTLLAGCTGGAAKGKTGEPGATADFSNLGLEATASTGIIRGIVVDDAIRPLANATIATTSPDGKPLNTTSSHDGAFGFDGLPPATYFLHITKPGYRAVQASADVVAGVKEPAVVKILLARDPTGLPYFSAYQFDAFIACSFTLVTVSFAACGLAADQTNNAFLVNYRPDKPPSHIQIEAIWDSTQALGNELGLSVTALGPPQVGVNGTEGASPIYITINATDAQKFNFTGPDAADVTIRLFSTQLTGTDVIPEEQAHALWKSNGYGVYNSTPLAGPVHTVFTSIPLGQDPFSSPDCLKYPVLFDACWGFGGEGMALQQRVTVYTHIFYGYLPPPDWRFSSGDPVPQPPA
jgi:hypothetical protein